MKQYILLATLCISLVACGTKKTEEASTSLTPEQEIQMVDSAAMETKERIEEIGKSADELQNEVDSLLNEINKK